ncbi:MAG: radical SAM protein [Verrucomicrobiae bacterium]|nr:radical SAM protein [Verrucomicrobiae bacterium]
MTEIFRSIQGESSFAGCPCFFIRLAGCNLDCAYCDTRYARTEGGPMDTEEILRQARASGCKLAEVTGGEPLLQPTTPDLLCKLCDEHFTVLLETNGSLDISPVDPRVIRIMDLKCPSSGQSERNRLENLRHLRPADEIKFVVKDREDFDWACQMTRQHGLADKTHCLLLSPLNDSGPRSLPPSALAEWILDSKLPFRLQLQLHKLIWPDRNRGV